MALVALVALGIGCGRTEDGAPTDNAGASGPVSPPRDETPPPPTDVPGRLPADCACDADAGSGDVRFSLYCFCAAFPTSCPTYEEARQAFRRDPSSELDLCPLAVPGQVVERVGCGRRILSRYGLAGSAFHYAEETRELTGAEVYSDVQFGPCESFSYSAGQVSPCDDYSVCSLCDDSCWPSCSVEGYASRYAPTSYEEWSRAARQTCNATSGITPTLTVGCGSLTVKANFGEAVFSQKTLDATLLRTRTDDECGGQWGEPPAACDSEVACSLCEDGCVTRASP